MDKKKKTASIVVMVIGLLLLVAGAVFLIMKLTAGPKVSDGEYLVSAGDWTMDDSGCKEEMCDRVIWKFTEIGKGTLTTNKHENDYNFDWILKDKKIKIRTEWLYEMDDEYDYTLNREDGILTLKKDDTEYRFTASQ